MYTNIHTNYSNDCSVINLPLKWRGTREIKVSAIAASAITLPYHSPYTYAAVDAIEYYKSYNVDR